MGMRRSRVPDSKVQMPITPMLDMTFQLLFFFLLWFRVSGLEGQMDLALPTDKPVVNQDNKPPDEPKAPGEEEDPKEPPQVTVIVKASQEPNKLGEISDISVRLLEGETPIREEGADPDRLLVLLQEHLKTVRETLGNKNDVKMMGQRRLRWQWVVKVRDACQKAGFTNAHFSPPPDL